MARTERGEIVLRAATARNSIAASGLPTWARLSADGTTIALDLHVQPNARMTARAGTHGDRLKVRIAAPATDNRANAALIEYLSDELGIARSALRIAHGTTSRRKRVEITAGIGAACALLAAWCDGETT